jgi:hypothetical protein
MKLSFDKFHPAENVLNVPHLLAGAILEDPSVLTDVVTEYLSS